MTYCIALQPLLYRCVVFPTFGLSAVLTGIAESVICLLTTAQADCELNQKYVVVLPESDYMAWCQFPRFPHEHT